MEELKVYPLIGLAAIQAGLSGSYRAWMIARNIDDGSGRLLKSRLYAAIEKHTTKRTRQRWVKEALQIGILTCSRCGKYFSYISVDRVARVYQAPSIITPIWIKPGDLFSPGWHALLWAGYLESRNDQQPISRAVLERITGMQRRSQSNLEKGCDLIVKYPCKVQLEKVKDPRQAYKDLQNNPDPSIRIQGNIITKQLPNTYKTQGINQARKGSTGKYRTLLNISLTKSQRDLDNKVRLYFKDRKKAYNNSEKYNQIKYCFIRQDPTGVNWFSEVDYI